MKRVSIGTAALALSVFLVGCGGGADYETPGPEQNVSEIDGEIAKVDVDGILCVVYDARGGGGSISCNWNAPGIVPDPS